MTETWDDITEVWWVDRGFRQRRRPPRSENTGPALLKDESKFIDFEHWSIFIPEKHSVLTIRSRLSRSLPDGRNATVHRRMRARHPGDEEAIEAGDLQAGIGDK